MTREEALKKLEFERKWLSDAGYTAYNIDIVFDTIKAVINDLCGEEKYEERNGTDREARTIVIKS